MKWLDESKYADIFFVLRLIILNEFWNGHLKWCFARRQAVPVAELHGVQSDRLLDPDIVRGGIRRRFAAKIRRDRGQATVGIVEPVLGVGASQTDDGRPLRGQREGIQRSGYHGRGGVKRSGQVHRCVSITLMRVENRAKTQHGSHARPLQNTRLLIDEYLSRFLAYRSFRQSEYASPLSSRVSFLTYRLRKNSRVEISNRWRGKRNEGKLIYFAYIARC